MSYKYKCIETFAVPERDDFEGNQTGKDFQIIEGSIWKSEEPIKDNETEVVLTKEDGAWIDIHKDVFDRMFDSVST